MVIGLDTNLFIYFLQGHPEFGLQAKEIIQSLIKPQNRGITSVITLLELLSIKRDEKEIINLRNTYLEIPHLATIDVDQIVSLEAARIRRVYGFRPTDVLQLATCLVNKADIFVTNDSRLQKFKEIKLVFLDNAVN